MTKRRPLATRRRAIGHQFEQLEPRQLLDSTTVINEIMYHPAAAGAPEWIELFNQMTVDMDLSGWSLSDAVTYRFPEGTVLPGRSHLVIASDPAGLQPQGVTALGPWTGSLANSGEQIVLRDRNDRSLSVVEYADDGDWPSAADGIGATLMKSDELMSSSEVDSSWTFSRRVGGTPGTSNSLGQAPVELAGGDLRLNEVSAAGDANLDVELINIGPLPLDLNGIGLLSSAAPTQPARGPQHQLPAEAIFAWTRPFADTPPSSNDVLALTTIDGRWIIDAVKLGAARRARLIDGAGEWGVPSEPTPGAANRFELEDRIVINEIMYHQRPQLSTPATAAVTETATLIPFDHPWRYNASGESLPAGWHQTTHVVGGNWLTGPGLLGFDADPTPPPGINTLLSDPTQDTIVTYYFETDLELTAIALAQLRTMQLRHVVDDGAVIYLNGVEILRVNLPEGLIDSTTVASPGVNNPAVSAAIDVPLERLRVGSNQLAVEVHQNTPLSNDVLFGLELQATRETAAAQPGTPFLENGEEWIELYNRGTTDVDLSGWRFDDAIDYDFPPGTVLTAGAYLVVAKDSATMRRDYPELTTILGDFDGSLSNSSERIQLWDTRGNLADEVAYFEDGRWPTAADGFGASLELSDPRADNSRGESWRASDEAARSTWQTYRYRGLGAKSNSSEPAVWNEFAFGFLDAAGEALVDDIRVVQDPDGAAIDLIQNGSFDDGSSAHWRMLGNHQRSQVVDDQGNYVLHVVSDGAAEYQGNQIETTFVDNTRINATTVYEISYRARWLSGSRRINSRLYFNRLARSTQLDVPERSGTPGRINSRWSENLGPVYDGLKHEPVLPTSQQPIQVSVTAADPDSLIEMTLWYQAGGQDWQHAPMARVAGQRYSGQIPPQPDGSVIQFYVRGTDGRGASTFFPAAGPESRALVQVLDSQPDDSLQNRFYLVMTQADDQLLHRPTNSLSNERLGATVVYRGQAFYDVGARLKGSFVGRNAARVGFNIVFPSDNKFRGIHTKVAIDRSTHAELGIDEILLKHAANHAGGIPGMYDDLVAFRDRTGRYGGRALLRMAAFDDVYLDSQFEQGSDGTMFEYEVIRWPTTTVDGNSESLKRAGGLEDPNGYANIEFRDQGDDKETYRWTNLIVSNRLQDDYTAIIALNKALGASAADLDAATRPIMDIDQWMRTAAYQALFGPADAYYTGSNVHNFRLYARPDGKVMYMPWDWDSAFQLPTGNSLIGAGRLARVVRLPENLRTYYGHLLSIVDTTFNADYMRRWTDHYSAVSGQNLSSRLTYIGQRATFAKTRIERDVPRIEFTLLTTGPIDTTETSLPVTGNGWVDVAEVRLQGSDQALPLTWSANGGTVANQWSTDLPLQRGTRDYVLQAYNDRGELLGAQSLQVTSRGSNEHLSAFLRVTEVHYNPPGSDDAEFVELMNVSQGQAAVTLDLAGSQVFVATDDGFRFPVGSQLSAGQAVVLVGNVEAFRAAHPQVSSDRIAGTLIGGLSNSGDTIRIADAAGGTLLQVTYDDLAPWPNGADGDGLSLQLADPPGTSTAQQGDASRWIAAPPTPAASGHANGDLTGDQQINEQDIDLLFAELRLGNQDPRFDLNRDTRVDPLDRNELVEHILATAFGDANLDLRWDEQDLVAVFQRGEYEDPVPGNSGWSDGDWDGDGDFTTRDLVLAFQRGRYLG